MNNKIKIIVVIFSILLIGYLVLINSTPDLKDVYQIEKIQVEKTNETLYLKKLSRGLNYSATYLSLLPGENEVNEETDFIFRGLDVNVFYRINQDTLEILSSSEVKVPEFIGFKTIVDITKIKSNLEYIELSKKYKQLGLNKFGTNIE